MEKEKRQTLREIYDELAEERCRHWRKNWEEIRDSREEPAVDEEIEKKLLATDHPFMFDQIVFKNDYYILRWSEAVAEHRIELTKHPACDPGDLLPNRAKKN